MSLDDYKEFYQQSILVAGAFRLSRELAEGQHGIACSSEL